MSFNLAARLSSLESISLSSLPLKANVYSPIFTGAFTLSDGISNSIAYLASTGIVFNNATVINSSFTVNDSTNHTTVATINSGGIAFNNATTINSSLTISDATNHTTVASINSRGIIFNSPMTITSTLSAPISAQARKYVDDTINNLINGAPTTLDTLKELADAIGNNPHLASDILSSIYSLNNLIHVNSSNSTILNTNSTLTVGQYNSGNGITNQFLGIDINNFNLYNSQFIVNSSTGVQTTATLYNRSSIDNLFSNFYNKATVNSLFSTVTGTSTLLGNYFDISTITSLLNTKQNTTIFGSGLTSVLNADNTYTVRIDGILLNTNFYTQISMNSILNNYYYTITNITTLLSTKQNNTVFGTGLSSVPYVVNGLTNYSGYLDGNYIDNKYYSKSYVDNALSTKQNNTAFGTGLTSVPYNVNGVTDYLVYLDGSY